MNIFVFQYLAWNDKGNQCQKLTVLHKMKLTGMYIMLHFVILTSSTFQRHPRWLAALNPTSPRSCNRKCICISSFKNLSTVVHSILSESRNKWIYKNQFAKSCEACATSFDIKITGYDVLFKFSHHFLNFYSSTHSRVHFHRTLDTTM